MASRDQAAAQTLESRTADLLAAGRLIARLQAENEKLREVAHAAAELMEVLFRGSPGWLDTPAGRRLIKAATALPPETT